MSNQRRRFGGLGAVFFLVSLGAIAWYVQRQSIPEARDELRKPATALPDVVEPEAPAVVAWQDRLDLAQFQLVAFRSEGAPPPASPTDPAAAVDAVDPAGGRYVQTLEDGHRVLLTLDPVLQESTLTLFRKREVPYGAAVVLDLRDNSVLAMAAHSAMDPQVDPLEILATAWAPAASTFKLITTAALLEKRAATPNTKVCFHGGLHDVVDEELKDNPALDKQCETLSDAVAQSYNLVLGKLALAHLNETELARAAATFQYETQIPFEFPIEPSPAHIPSDAMSRAKVAAGFWHVDQSPVHGAIVASIFARGGVYQAPHVVQRVMAPDGSDITPERAKEGRVVARDIADEVGRMMVATTTVGTAQKSFVDDQGAPYIPGIEIAGKTGSLTGKRAPFLNYNWFIGYAPAKDPEIAFAVVIANEPKWQIKAHYAARRIIQIYLERRDAISEQRAARLTPDALVLPVRDPETGAVLASTATLGPTPPRRTPPPPADAGTLPPTPGPLPAITAEKQPAPDAVPSPAEAEKASEPAPHAPAPPSGD